MSEFGKPVYVEDFVAVPTSALQGLCCENIPLVFVWCLYFGRNGKAKTSHQKWEILYYNEFKWCDAPLAVVNQMRAYSNYQLWGA